MGKHKSYDDEWLATELARGKLKRVEIARAMGLSAAHVGRIAAGRLRRDLQPRIQAMRAAFDHDPRLTASAFVKAMLARHIKLGVEGDSETARRCREFLIKQVLGFRQDTQTAVEKADLFRL